MLNFQTEITACLPATPRQRHAPQMRGHGQAGSRFPPAPLQAEPLPMAV
jgi:hypothetical protein